MTVASDDDLLRLTGIGKSFGGIQALSDVSITVPYDRIVGVIGPNGAGKTSLFNVITGAYRATTGDIALAGKTITQWPSHRIVRAGISRTFQNIRLFASMTVWEHLLVGQPRQGSPLRGILPLARADKAVAERAEEAMLLGSACRISVTSSPRPALRRAAQGGDGARAHRRTQAAVARRAVPDNHDEASELRDLLLKINKRGLSILLIEHDMAFVMNLCHHLYVLDFGSIIASGDPTAIRRDPVVLDAYLGRETAC